MIIILTMLLGLFVTTTVILCYLTYNSQNKIDIYESWIVEFKNDINEVYQEIKGVKHHYSDRGCAEYNLRKRL